MNNPNNILENTTGLFGVSTYLTYYKDQDAYSN